MTGIHTIDLALRVIGALYVIFTMGQMLAPKKSKLAEVLADASLASTKGKKTP